MTAAYDAFVANPDPLKWVALAKLVLIYGLIFGWAAWTLWPRRR